MKRALEIAMYALMAMVLVWAIASIITDKEHVCYCPEMVRFTSEKGTWNFPTDNLLLIEFKDGVPVATYRESP